MAERTRYRRTRLWEADKAIPFLLRAGRLHLPDVAAGAVGQGDRDQAEQKRRVEQAASVLNLTDYLDRRPGQLSGGQRQRVAIARALVTKPSILLADEPTGALDSKTGIAVLEALQRVNQALGTTTAVITHNAGIAQMADRVIVLADGRISETRENATPLPPRELSW